MNERDWTMMCVGELQVLRLNPSPELGTQLGRRAQMGPSQQVMGEAQ